MSYYIEKQFECAVAHRVYNQELCQTMYGGGRSNPCRSIHGHSAVFMIGIESDTLVNDMVIDFNNLKIIKSALDQHYDHRFTLCRDDPLFEFLVKGAYESLVSKGIADGVVGEFIPFNLDEIVELDGGDGFRVYTVHIDDSLRGIDSPLIELLDSFTITDFSTTSENLAHWMFNVVSNRFNYVRETTNDLYLRNILDNCQVAKVSYKESAKSIAVYSE